MPPEDYPCLRFQAPFQSARRSLRHLATYGSTNKYIPVKKTKAKRGHRQEAHPVGISVFKHGHAVKDDDQRKGDRQPAVQLPNPLLQFKWDLFSRVSS